MSTLSQSLLLSPPTLSYSASYLVAVPRDDRLPPLRDRVHDVHREDLHRDGAAADLDAVDLSRHLPRGGGEERDEPVGEVERRLVNLRPGLQPIRHLDVGGNVRAVDLVAAPDGALDAPPDVDAESGADREAVPEPLDDSRVGEVVLERPRRVGLL